MQGKMIKSFMLAAVLGSSLWAAGCKVEVLPTREQQKEADEKNKPKDGMNTAAVVVPAPNSDNAAEVIASCGPAASDEVLNINDKHDAGNVRHMVYRESREVTLDFVPLQTSNNNGHSSSNTVWRFNEARVENQRLLTAANIKVYLPCAASALAKEF